MAEIELVIKIDEKYWSNIKEVVEDGGGDYSPWLEIASGVPLPKGHGRLIEVTEKLEQELFTFCRPTGIDEAPFEDATMITDNATTILEADKVRSATARRAVETDDEESESKEMSKEKTIRALEALENDFLYDDEDYADDSKEYKDTVIALRMAIDMLKQEPKTGYWEREIISLPLSDSSKECYKCSNCNTHWEYAFKYCPNCGARMIESEEE